MRAAEASRAERRRRPTEARAQGGPRSTGRVVSVFKVCLHVPPAVPTWEPSQRRRGQTRLRSGDETSSRRRQVIDDSSPSPRRRRRRLRRRRRRRRQAGASPPARTRRGVILYSFCVSYFFSLLGGLSYRYRVAARVPRDARRCAAPLHRKCASLCIPRTTAFDPSPAAVSSAPTSARNARVVIFRPDVCLGERWRKFRLACGLASSRSCYALHRHCRAAGRHGGEPVVHHRRNLAVHCRQHLCARRARRRLGNVRRGTLIEAAVRARRTPRRALSARADDGPPVPRCPRVCPRRCAGPYSTTTRCRPFPTRRSSSWPSC